MSQYSRYAMSRAWLLSRFSVIVPHSLPARLAVLALFAVVTPVRADNSLSAYETMLEQLQYHPSVLIAESSARKWKANAAGALGLPNPNVTLGLNNLPVNRPTQFDRYLPSSRSLEFKQTLPGLDGREALRNTRLARADLATLERIEVMAGLRKRLIIAFAERQRIRESKVALDHKVALLLELERWLRGEMEGGGAVYNRFDELDVQQGRIREQRLMLEGEDQRWQAELRQLIDRNPEDITLPPISVRSWGGAPEELIPVQVALGKLKVARGEVRERQAAFDPDYAVGMAWQQREAGANFDGDDWFTLKFTASIPLWADTNQKPKLASAEEAVTRAVAEQEQQLRIARAEYDSALADYQTTDALLQALSQRSARLKDLEASNRRRYEAGEGALEMVVEPAIKRAELAMELAKQRARHTIAAARINALIMEPEK